MIVAAFISADKLPLVAVVHVTDADPLFHDEVVGRVVPVYCQRLVQICTRLLCHCWDELEVYADVARVPLVVLDGVDNALAFVVLPQTCFVFRFFAVVAQKPIVNRVLSLALFIVHVFVFQPVVFLFVREVEHLLLL